MRVLHVTQAMKRMLYYNQYRRVKCIQDLSELKLPKQFKRFFFRKFR